MLQFLANNAGTIVVALAVAAVVGAIVVHLIRERRRGVSSCGCSCGQCRGGCHSRY